MKKTARVLGVITICLIGLTVIFVLEESLRGKITLSRYSTQLHAQGQTLDYASLTPLKPISEQNIALDLNALTNSLNPYFALSEDAPLAMTHVAPGKAVPAWRLNSWAAYKGKSNSWSAFQKEIQPAMTVLGQFESIWPKTNFDDGYDYASGFLQSNVQWTLILAKQTVVLLSEAVEYDLQRGDLDSARKHLRSILAITRALGKQTLIISELVDEACATIAWNATWSALQTENWRDEQLAELQSAWETAGDFPSAMAKSCELERGMTVHYFQQLRESRSAAAERLASWSALPDFFGTDESFGPPTRGVLLLYVHLPVWKVSWSAQDELRALEKWQPIVEGGKVAAVKSWLDAKSFFDGDDLTPSELGFGITASKKSGWYDRFRYLFSSEPFSVSGATILRPLEVETEKNLAIVAIALKRYQIRHGKPATELAALVPEFLAEIPRDRMDGKPLRYHLSAGNNFKLYSVGLNGIDDGGDPTPETQGNKFSNIWQGKDAVWPVPSESE